MSFQELSLNKNILKAIDELGFKEPTYIQQRAIPVILEKKDVFATAKTGTGKTAVFALPILHRLKKNSPKYTRTLIVAPTKELCMQIYEEINSYAKYMDIKTALIIGGEDFAKQKRILKSGVDMVVATPGKILEHIESGFDVKLLDFFVLDEADRMLDMGFVKDIKKIDSFIGRKRQTLLFSATTSPKIAKLSKLLLKKPVFIETDKQNSPVEDIKQVAYKVDTEQKAEAVAYLISSNNFSQAIVFTQTKKSVSEVVDMLESYDISSRPLHGDIQKSTRTKNIKDFKARKFRVLVATDIASRGIDIKDLPAVINYELPVVAADYIHRVGRTARMGNDGVAISLLDVDERFDIRAIEKLIDQKIPQEILEGFEPNPKLKRGDEDKPKPKNEYKNQYKTRKKVKLSQKKRKTTKRDR